MTDFEEISSYKVIVIIIFIQSMAKKKNQKKAESHAKKSAVETLRFQTHWGVKQLGQQDGNLFHELVDAEVNFIAELDLAQDLLAIKSLVDGVKQSFAVVPTAEKGDFTKSPTAVALGIAHINEINNIGIPLSWSEMIAQKNTDNLLSRRIPEPNCRLGKDKWL